jgi:hypothetical protein
MTAPVDQKALLWNATPPAPQQPTAGQRLFEFTRASDRAPMMCELRGHGEFGWEVQFLERGELLYSRRFDTRALAIQWAELERAALEEAESRRP